MAYPEKDKETEFEFFYYVASQEGTMEFVSRQFVSSFQILFDFAILMVHVIRDLDHKQREQERIFFFIVWGFSISMVFIILASCCLISCLSLITKKYEIPQAAPDDADGDETQREEKNVVQKRLEYQIKNDYHNKLKSFKKFQRRQTQMNKENSDLVEMP